MRMRSVPPLAVLSLAALLFFPARLSAQFIEHFDNPASVAAWRHATGDGNATMEFRAGGESYASILVDGTHDKRGIWWALVECPVTGLDLSLLRQPGHEVRIEARIRASHAPRRINLQVQTQHTANPHSHLMEFDIPDTDQWHTISMTTHGFDAKPGDTLIAHMALMDWGLEKYRVDVDYVKVDIVDVATAGPDKGDPIPYQPPVADAAGFQYHLPVAQDSTLDLENTEMNLNDWSVQEIGGRKVNLVTADGSHYVILRWDLSAYKGRKIDGSGLLELTTYSVQQKSHDVKDFGIVRVVEILGGDPAWDQNTVTTENFRQSQPLTRVLNTQMIIDWPITSGDGSRTYLTIPRVILQRMIDGQTLGIAIKPLGAISAAFYAMEQDSGKNAAKLDFNLAK